MNSDNKICANLVEVKVAADRFATHNAIEAAVLFSERACLSQKDRVHLRIVIEELITNILKHGRLSDWSIIDFRLERVGEHASIKLVDQGIPFNPGRDLPIGKGHDSDGEGGQGWPLVMSWCRIADYRNEQGQNRLHLVLPLEGASLSDRKGE